jgi:hypothetical protein
LSRARLIPGLAVAPAALQADGLPRMDVALFIGFASRGPCHRPVVVDSLADYAAIFGGDLRLARDAGNGGDVFAALPATVRHWFAGGGTRAHIIRIARTAALEKQAGGNPAGADVAGAARFALPQALVGGAPLVLRAASVGSWADGLRVAARLDRSLGRLRLVLRCDLGTERRIFGPYGLHPADPDSWWALADDDAHFADPAAALAGRPWLVPDGLAAPIDVSGLSDLWTEPAAPIDDGRTPLERDGLSHVDAGLFLDPRMATASIDALPELARALRDLEGAQLLGIHGAFALAGGADFAEPSIIAIPDAIQPAFMRRAPPPLAPPTPGPAAPPASWAGHGGPCTLPEKLAGPAAHRFLDCGTRLIAAPRFDAIPSPRATGVLRLSWQESEPAAIYVLEAANRPDFADARVIARTVATHHDVLLAREGGHWFRLTAQVGSNISLPDVAGVMALASLWETAPGFDGARLIDVQAAAIRLAAAMGDQFLLLSLPGDWRAAAAADHAAALSARFAGAPRPLSHAAMHHPWPVTMAAGGARATPPDGAVAARMAARARRDGAWAAPGGQILADVVALSPALMAGDAEALAQARINRIAAVPAGFVASDVMTLSPEHDWGWINVRRLVSLLRRMAVREGAAYVFEPWGDTLRRAIERRFGAMLEYLARRGAFAGRGLDDSFRLVVGAPGSRHDDGRLVIEIAIAPAQPLRFLTITLAQRGARLGIVEAP